MPADLMVNTCLGKKFGIQLKGDAFSTDPYELEVYLQEAILELGLGV